MSKNKKIFQFKIQLKYLSTPVWRRVQVPSDLTFHQFHGVIQILFHWQSYHIYAFSYDDTYIEIPPKEEPMVKRYETENAKKKKLNDYFNNKNDKIVYTYDFGDNWEHEIVLEDILEAKNDKEYPVCIKGKGHTPPEDSGGPPGFEKMKKILKNPDHEEYEHMKQWAGEWKKYEAFDKDDINAGLKNLKDDDYEIQIF